MDISRQHINIAIDSLIIICAIVGLCVSVLTLLMMFISRVKTDKDQVNNLLTIKTCVINVISGCLMLDMYCYTIHGHLYPNNSYFDGWWCQIKSYLYYSSGAGVMYSLFLHGAYRFCRVVLSSRLLLQSFRVYRFAIVIQWSFCLLSILIIFLLGDIRYVLDDFNCQIEIINVRGMLLLLPIVYFIPSTLTTNFYTYTIMFFRKRSKIRGNMLQQASNRRDIIVLTRIVMTLSFMIIVGLPTIVFCLMFYIQGQVPWWSRQVGWLSVAIAYCGVCIILIIVSPHLRKLWMPPWNRVRPY